MAHLGQPDDVDVCLNLKDWLFALESEEAMSEMWFDKRESIMREEICWHSTFRNLQIKAKNNHKAQLNGNVRSHVMQKYPVDVITVRIKLFQL